MLQLRVVVIIFVASGFSLAEESIKSAFIYLGEISHPSGKKADKVRLAFMHHWVKISHIKMTLAFGVMISALLKNI